MAGLHSKFGLELYKVSGEAQCSFTVDNFDQLRILTTHTPTTLFRFLNKSIYHSLLRFLTPVSGYEWRDEVSHVNRKAVFECEIPSFLP